MRWPIRVLMALTIIAAGCSTNATEGVSPIPGSSDARAEYRFPAAPAVSERPLGARVTGALDRLATSFLDEGLDPQALEAIAASEDPRLGWFISDLLRFTMGGDDQGALVAAFRRVTGVDPRDHPQFAQSAWLSITNHLIAWDLAAPAGYREVKGRLFVQVEPAWAPFFADENSAIDWRLVSWGGVFIDDRPEGDPDPCPRGCIPALDDPALTDADGGDWYPGDRIVFGVVVGDEAVAFPKHIMEVHEMVNVTIGGRRVGIPYCTLCGSAQAYFTDSVPDGVAMPVLRTSGLLSRSNKVMYDLRTNSVFNTFTGEALSGPLQDEVVELAQTTVVASTWAEWKRAYPDTKIVAEDGGIGRSYPEDPLGGRDDDGPIFPVGSVDPRLPVQAQVLGVIAPDGTPVAFAVEQARAALLDGRRVVESGVELVADGGGLRAQAREGRELTAHQAFWFAWSQFHPRTEVWLPIR